MNGRSRGKWVVSEWNGRMVIGCDDGGRGGVEGGEEEVSSKNNVR